MCLNIFLLCRGVDTIIHFYSARHDSTSCSSNLIGYPRVSKHLSPLVPSPTHSSNNMFPAFCLHCMITEEGTGYSETSVTKYQQLRATSGNSEGLNITECQWFGYIFSCQYTHFRSTELHECCLRTSILRYYSNMWAKKW